MIWAWWIRGIHALLGLSLVLVWFVIDTGDPEHLWLGYFALALVALRFAIGFFGPRDSAHFRHVTASLRSFPEFLKNHFRGRETHSKTTHNPLAWITYFLMWFLIAGLAVSGYLLGTDAYWGDEGMESFHLWKSRLLMALVGLHFAGLLMDTVLFRRHTWKGMIDGRAPQSWRTR